MKKKEYGEYVRSIVAVHGLVSADGGDWTDAKTLDLIKDESLSDSFKLELLKRKLERKMKKFVGGGKVKKEASHVNASENIDCGP